MLPPIILASQSPRRRELLQQIGLPFTVHSADVDETVHQDENIQDYIHRVALEKAQTVHQQFPHHLIIAADTIVTIDQHILQKPQNQSHAFAMWQQLSGRQHQVYSCVVIGYQQQYYHAIVSSQILFKTLDQTDMQQHWQTGEPRDKAGGYAIQGYAARWVKQLTGSYSAVVGLPIFETVQLLEDILHCQLPYSS